MSAEQIFNKVSNLIEKSKGKPLLFSSGATYCFKLKRLYQAEELSLWEESNGIDLPEEYRIFLLTVGACEIFYGGSDHNRGIDFYKLDEIFDLYENCFDEPELYLFNKLLPVAGDENLQEIAAFAMERKAPNNFAPFWHEYVPEEWIDTADELNDWTKFSSWLKVLVENEGYRPLD